MRLLFFIHSLSGGGAERVTVNLANHWAAKGWQITIVTLAPLSLDFYKLDPAVERIALELAGESRNVLAGLWKNVQRVRALRQVLRQVQPDIALAVMSTANVILALATRGLANLCAIGAERTHPPQFPLGAQWEALRKIYLRSISRRCCAHAGKCGVAKEAHPRPAGSDHPEHGALAPGGSSATSYPGNSPRRPSVYAPGSWSAEEGEGI